MLPCHVGMAVSKLSMTTLSMVNERPSELMSAFSTGSSAAVVGLWLQESDAIMASFTTMHLHLITSRDQTRPSS